MTFEQWLDSYYKEYGPFDGNEWITWATKDAWEAATKAENERCIQCCREEAHDCYLHGADTHVIGYCIDRMSL